MHSTFGPWNNEYAESAGSVYRQACPRDGINEGGFGEACFRRASRSWGVGSVHIAWGGVVRRGLCWPEYVYAVCFVFYAIQRSILRVIRHRRWWHDRIKKKKTSMARGPVIRNACRSTRNMYQVLSKFGTSKIIVYPSGKLLLLHGFELGNKFWPGCSSWQSWKNVRTRYFFIFCVVRVSAKVEFTR